MKYFLKNKLIFFLLIMAIIINAATSPLVLYFAGKIAQTYIFSNSELVDPAIATINIILFFIILFVNTVSILCRRYFRIILLRKSTFQLREDVSKGITKISLKKLGEKLELSSLYTNNIDQVYNSYLDQFIYLLFYSALFISTLVVVSIIWIHLLWISLIIVILGFLVNRISKKYTERGYLLEQKSESEYVRDAGKSFNSYKTFWLTNKRSFFIEYLSKIFVVYKKKSYKSINNLMVMIAILNITIFIIQFSTLVASVLVFYYIPGQLEAGFLISIIGLSGTLIASFSILIRSGISYRSSRILLKKFEIESELISSEFHEEIQNINVTNLTFNNNEKPVFSKNNFAFEKNKKYLIKGASGSGKSLLIKFILGINENEESNIFINNKNIKNISKDDYIRKISYLTNKAFLFNDNILNNIILEKELDQNKLKNLCNILEISDDLLNTKNMEKLSSGEKQKVAFARELYKNNKILIADEAFSNLDKKVKIKLNDFLTNQKELTLFVIAHHLDDEIERGFDEIIELS
ncbi:ATP-binding cassette domain-containing protein [Mycoplasmopsis agassizii]|uniref:ABC transporter ATP-binding protein n=1 Tax=Mycoplasmopsis agassizii TaxID=33922 RepID=A0ABX4H6H5_9BACT|nr:ABC transporter ATP-binding protein [Mycoplasmopsis agassizii]PAF55510.1 ABC transporter ATP-binding protein [Mycoplasmopsis agassizii]SMC18004.1 ABC-type multidrug transport system, ATPase and permease component [Mycoplasmopsis agassizii]